MESLTKAAGSWGASTTLPSNQIKEKDGPTELTSFFKFTREVLNLAAAKGTLAIAQSDLLESEKEAGLKALTVHRPDATLLDYLRQARRNLRESDLPSA